MTAATADEPRLPESGRSWVVAVGCAIGLAVAFGPAVIASFGLYLKPISQEFGWSRTEVAVIYSIVSILGAVGTPLLGIVLDRYGSRPVLLIATVLLPLGLSLAAFLPRDYPLFLAWGVLMGFIAMVTSPAAYVNLIPQWFDRRLGLAVSFAMTGSALGQSLFLMGHGALLARFDWRHAWLIMAGVVALVGIVNAVLVLRDRDDLQQLRRSGLAMQLPGRSVGEALRTPTFWCAIAAYLIVMLVIGAMLAHLAALLGDRGLGVSQAASVVACVGVVSVIGRVATGLVLDRMDYGLLGFIIFPTQALGCLLLIADVPDIWLYVAAGLIGLSYGVEADMLPFMLRRTFGIRSFGRLYGIGFGLVQLGPVAGPLILGYAFDRFGSYHAGLYVLAALSCASAVLIAAASWLGRAERLRQLHPHEAAASLAR